MYVEIVDAYFLINKIINKGNVLIEIILLIAFLPWIVFFGFYANRFGYVVIYDSSKNMSYRRGLICGYKSQVKIDDIHEIIVATFPKEGTYYVFKDSIHTKYEGGFKKSFFRIEKMIET